MIDEDWPEKPRTLYQEMSIRHERRILGIVLATVFAGGLLLGSEGAGVGWIVGAILPVPLAILYAFYANARDRLEIRRVLYLNGGLQ